MRALITGAASGIGRATAIRLAGRLGPKAQIALVDRNETALAAVASEIDGLSARSLAITADLGDPAAPAGIVAQTCDAFGGLDLLVSNAGINPKAALTELSTEAWDRVQAVNTRATWLLAKAAHADLARTRGSIVAVTSVAATAPTPMCGAYAVSKAALLMLVRQMALEWGPDGIRVNAVSPGSVPTGLSPERYATEEGRDLARSRNPLGAIGTPEDIAAAILYLAGPDAAFVTGAELVVDGGLQVMSMHRGAASLTRA